VRDGQIEPERPEATAEPELLIGERELLRGVDTMARAIARDWSESGELLVVALLDGVFVFVADLVRALWRHGVRSRIAFVRASSYGSGTVSTGTVQLGGESDLDVAGRTVLLVDDILDTGRTLDRAREHLGELGATTVVTAVLLDKPSRRQVPIEADHVGFEVPDRFVVGYGIDCAEDYRYLPYIATLATPGTHATGPGHDPKPAPRARNLEPDR